MMISPLMTISLSNLRKQPIMIDANIFMVGIENRGSDPNCSFENMRDLFIVPMLESFSQIYIHEVVYSELDDDAKKLVDEYLQGGRVEDTGTGTCPTPIVREYQVTHFRFLDFNYRWLPDRRERLKDERKGQTCLNYSDAQKRRRSQWP